MSESNCDTPGNSPPGFVSIDVTETLCFFDEKPDWSEKQATGVVGVVGEDLNVACFEHYLKGKGATVTVLDQSVTTGERKGPWLDRWVVARWEDGSKTVFQAEIKNWSAHAKGGEILKLDATGEEVANYKQRRWEKHWDSKSGTLRTHAIAKVLVQMNPPRDLAGEKIIPLLIFWEALGPRNQANNHLIKIDQPTCDFPFDPPSTWPDAHEFPALWIFSVSSYLRSISDDKIELQMPNAAKRIEILNRLFSTT